MGAEIGNKSAEKLYTPELRALAYKSYCEHLSKGKSKKSWIFKHEDISLTWETFEKYIKEYAHEFDSEEKKVAEAEGFNHWEGIVEDSAKGTNKDANTASLQMLMRNKYGWDKNEKNSDVPINPQFEALMMQIKSYQLKRRIDSKIINNDK